MKRKSARVPDCARVEIGFDGQIELEALRLFGLPEAAPAADDADAAKVALLARLGGIGAELATVLVHEALYRPFANRRAVAAYAGLMPSPFASGDRHRGQASPKRAIRCCARAWSNSPGSGCDTSPTLP